MASMKLNVEDYRRAAKNVLPRFVFDYVDGAAERGECLRRNRAGLDQLALLPRTLRDTSTLDTSIEVFGQRWRHPFAVAPMGFNGLTRPRGDVLLARAAASRLMTVPTGICRTSAISLYESPSTYARKTVSRCASGNPLTRLITCAAST